MNPAFDLMDQNPFATVITVVDGLPFVSHLPLTPKVSGEGIELIGHMARGNPHSKVLSSSPVTVVFQGGHGYITPKWYEENDVPTWNYSTVHIKGEVELIEDHEGIVDCLKELTSHVERFWPSGWEFYIPDDMGGQFLSRSIVGFKVKVDDVKFKQKLSQSKTSADRAGVLKGLESRDDGASRALLNDMLKLYSSDGKSRKR